MTRALYFNSKKNILLQILLKYGKIDLSIFRSKTVAEGKYNTLGDMIELYNALDNQINVKMQQNGVEPFCKKGCKHCCDEYFYVSMVEYFAIKNYLESRGKKVTSFYKKSTALCAKLSAAYPNEWNKLTSEANNITEDTDDRAILKFSDCIFLKNKKCSIYPARPIICRLYGISYSYEYCDDITTKLLDSFSENPNMIFKHMIDIPYCDELRIGIDYINLGGGFTHFRKPYPLFWWIANDGKYEQEYTDFCKEAKTP